MISDKKKLLKDGYLYFNLKDIDNNLYNELYNNFNKNMAIDKIDSLRYNGTICISDSEFLIENIDSYFNNLLIEYNLSCNTDIQYYLHPTNNPTHINLSLNLRGSYNSLNQIETKLKNISSSISQIWYYGQNGYSNKINNILSKIYQKTIIELYSNYISNKDNYFNTISNKTELTLYIKDNFIEVHNDGYLKGRLCVILIYLNDDYNNTFGGELILNNSNVIEPKFGNVVILDFTENNPLHSVNSVLSDNFKRFAFIKFFNQN
jgi:hypothetical protein